MSTTPHHLWRLTLTTPPTPAWSLTLALTPRVAQAQHGLSSWGMARSRRSLIVACVFLAPPPTPPNPRTDLSLENQVRLPEWGQKGTPSAHRCFHTSHSQQMPVRMPLGGSGGSTNVWAKPPWQSPGETATQMGGSVNTDVAMWGSGHVNKGVGPKRKIKSNSLLEKYILTK